MKRDDQLRSDGVDVSRESVFGTELKPYDEAIGLKRSREQILNQRKAEKSTMETHEEFIFEERSVGIAKPVKPFRTLTAEPKGAKSKVPRLGVALTALQKAHAASKAALLKRKITAMTKPGPGASVGAAPASHGPGAAEGAAPAFGAVASRGPGAPMGAARGPPRVVSMWCPSAKLIAEYNSLPSTRIVAVETTLVAD